MAGPAFAMPHVPPPEMAMQMTRNGTMDLSSAWRDPRESDFVPQSTMADMKARSGWASEFGNGPQMQAPVSSSQLATVQRPNYMQNSMYGMGRPMGMFSSMNMAPGPIQMPDNGKGKSREIDFEAAFAQLEQSFGPSTQETARIEELDDTADLAASMAETTLKDSDGVVGSDFQTYVGAHTTPQTDRN